MRVPLCLKLIGIRVAVINWSLRAVELVATGNHAIFKVVFDLVVAADLPTAIAECQEKCGHTEGDDDCREGKCLWKGV